MAVRSSDYVLDELLCFLSNPLFQVPVLSFMENSCLIFDTSSEDSPEYREIHNQYRKLVDSLLEAYRVDTGLSHDDIIKAMKDLNAKPELRKMFQELFEQVLAMDDFTIFVHLMINKNLELQKQALMLITMMQGQLPSSLQQGGSSPRMSTAPSSQQDEDEILRAVLEESKREYEAQQRQNRKEEDDYKAVVNISHVEAKRLDDAHKQEQDKLSEVLKSTMRIGDGPPPSASPGVAGGLAAMGALPALPKDVSKPVQAPAISKSPAPAAAAAVSAPVVNKPPAAAAAAPSKPVPMVAVHGLAPVPGANKSQNSKDAAADWLKTAENEVKTSDAHSKAVYAAAASMAGMSEDEYKQRVNFLKQQRDKLMEMKRREREKQLLTAESSQPTRPASARAARNAMSRKEVPSEPAEPTEEEKKLAMRRAIANRIKSELMDSNDS